MGMSTKTKVKKEKKALGAEISVEVDIPEKVTAKFADNTLEIGGPKGKVTKDFSKIPVNLNIDNKKITIKPYGNRKKNLAIANTTRSVIRNMMEGVLGGFTYKLKVVYAHFPISVKVKERWIFIENFLGERSPRTVKIIGDCKASAQGEDLLIQGPSLEDVSQTAANVELATKIKEKDLRVFLDGLYIYAKEKGM